MNFNRHTLTKFLKYSQVRIYTGGLYFTVVIGLVELLNFYYLLAVCIAFLPSYLLEFAINTKWTYQEGNE